MINLIFTQISFYFYFCKSFIIPFFVSANKFGIEEVNPAVVSLISHATQEKLRDYASKLSVIAEHRGEVYKVIW